MAASKPGAGYSTRPRNTLNGDHGRDGPSTTFAAGRLNPPPAKKAKLCHNLHGLNYSRASLEVEHDQIEDGDDTVDLVSSEPRRRSISIANSQNSQSMRSSNVKTAQSNVPEYRVAERHTQTGGRKRPRYPRSGEQRDEEEIVRRFVPPLPSSDDEEPSCANAPTVSASSPTHNARDQARNVISDHAGRLKRAFSPASTTVAKAEAGKAAARKMGIIIDQFTPRSQQKRYNNNTSPDELAPTAQDVSETSAAKRRMQYSPKSLSRRGDIATTKFSNPGRPLSSKPNENGERPLARDGPTQSKGVQLHVNRGASGSYFYNRSTTNRDEPCCLSLREISTILHPTDEAGEILQDLEYLTVNLQRVQSVTLPDEEAQSRCSIVKIFQSHDHARHRGPQLMLEFSTPNECQSFLEWVTEAQAGAKLNIPVRFAKMEKLERDLLEMEKRIKGNRTGGDNNAISYADDIKMMQHNQGQRQGEALRTLGSSHGQLNPRPKMKDKMGPSPGYMSIEPTQQLDLQKPARSLRSAPSLADSRDPAAFAPSAPQESGRLTRSAFPTSQSTFALEDSPEPDPTWTELNPGWETKWRSSLVYPPQGKNRATVDKEDIHRLDEGQFLNDNLIIFYLRYLQAKLEIDRPDLAQRIYFQNTFFYDKLKSGKGGRSINYDSVRTWTSKVDLFSKDYIIVPINEFTHWYVAIVYNAPKLLPSPTGPEEPDSRSTDPITIEDDVETSASKDLPISSSDKITGGVSNSEQAVVDDLAGSLRRSTTHAADDATEAPVEPDRTIHRIQDSDDSRAESEQTVQVIVKDSDDTKAEPEQVAPANNAQGQRTTGKRHSTGPRKYDLRQPRIITLDSLGGTHSPTCNILKQYLVAELRDKKGIEIPVPGALGMTAKGVPEQTNHCDCGLYLLGYVQEFLKDPDRFVHSLLQRDDEIQWGLNPSQLREEMRDVIFELQEEQQEQQRREREQKRHAALSKKGKAAETGLNMRNDAAARESRNGHQTTSPHFPEALNSQEPRQAAQRGPQLSVQVANGDVQMGNEVIVRTDCPGKEDKSKDVRSQPGLSRPRPFPSHPEPSSSRLQPSLPKHTPREIFRGSQTRTAQRRTQEGPAKEKRSPAIQRSNVVQAQTPLQTIERSSNPSDDLHVPGEFPSTPARPGTSSSSSTSSSTSSTSSDGPRATEKSTQKSQPEPTAAPRDGTPANPMVLTDAEDESRETRRVEPSAPKNPRKTDFFIPIPSRRAGARSPFFHNGASGSRVTAARLREEEPSNVEVLDISD
ncbi:hypothetical protein GGR56DRAFT_129724 [Xylariaceae sp. FL0804]|nr:hypothetical protein GGR56DRAFT_129724 [Xylariaceae sp. FL0804]